MKLNLKEILKDNFARGTIVMTVMTILGAALNFLVHPILTRRLTIAEYGDFQALLSFITIIAVVSGVIQMTLTKEFSLLKKNSLAQISSLRKTIIIKLWLYGGVAFIILVIMSKPLADIFNIGHPLYIILTAAMVIYLFPLAVNRAIIAGLEKFSSLSINMFIDSFTRLAIIILLVVAWQLKLTGASIALGATSLLSFFISYLQIRKLGLPAADNNYIATPKPIIKYGLTVLWFTILSQFFFNFDILFVKATFDPTTAGLYGSLITIGRIIFFIGGSVPLIVFPIVAGLDHNDHEKKNKIFYKALGFVMMLALPAAGAIALFPNFVIRFIVGQKYLAVASLLPKIALMFLLLTIFQVTSQYFLALNRKLSIWLLSFGVILEIILLNMFHSSLSQVIIMTSVVFLLINVSLFILFFKDRRVNKLSLKQL
jgi:O-antigen/teichoic acid export membrane protein